jgi:hypothetical protein
MAKRRGQKQFEITSPDHWRIREIKPAAGFAIGIEGTRKCEGRKPLDEFSRAPSREIR